MNTVNDWHVEKVTNINWSRELDFIRDKLSMANKRILELEFEVTQLRGCIYARDKTIKELIGMPGLATNVEHLPESAVVGGI